MEPNQYRFTRTFLNGEALRIFDLKLTELHHEIVANLIVVMNHVVTYFGPKQCLSKHKCYIWYKKEKPRKLTTRQYVELVRDLNSRTAQMPLLFEKNQQLDESELVDYLANKAPRSHKAMLISKGFYPETGDLATSVEHCEQADTTDNIIVAKFSASDKESDTKRKKKRFKFKEREENGKKRHKKHSSLYWYLHDENKSHTSRECKVLKARTKYKDNPKYSKKDYKNKFKELNILEREVAHQRAKYLKYKKLNKVFSKNKTPKNETVILDDTSDSNYSSISQAENSLDKDNKYYIAYDSDSADDDEIINSSIGSEGNI